MEWLTEAIMMFFAISLVIFVALIGITFCVLWILVVLAQYEKWFIEDIEGEEDSNENTHRPWIKEIKNHDR